MAGAPVWIRWKRDGRSTWSIAHRALGAGHRMEPLLDRAVELACGRATPEPMLAALEITAAGWTARPCLACLTRWTGGR